MLSVKISHLVFLVKTYFYKVFWSQTSFYITFPYIHQYIKAYKYDLDPKTLKILPNDNYLIICLDSINHLADKDKNP